MSTDTVQTDAQVAAVPSPALPNRINELVEASGWSPARVAHHIGIDEHALTRYVRGEEEVPEHVATSLADLFAVSKAWLLARAGLPHLDRFITEVR